ncbi:MAG: hypothetical protein KJO62_00685, partial [Gammaproteobacteria bacterium]|nr:hypothetical protein [Gammaproteobacteria bacterium]
MKRLSTSRWIFTAILFSLLTACATTQRGLPPWPAELPPVEEFLSAHRADAANAAVQNEAEYLKWIKRFYLGWALYPNGWQWLTDTVMRETPDYQQRLHLKHQMADIGQRIGAEWAKDSRHRYINTSHLMVWGDAVKLAVRKGTQMQLADAISADVDGLLATTVR